MIASIDVRIAFEYGALTGVQWLSTIAPWGELEWSHAATGGCLTATWKMDLPPSMSHPALQRNADIQIKVGPSTVWSGFLAQPDYDDDWTFTANGYFQQGSQYLCLDSGGNTTTTPNTAIDQAITRGLPWTRPTSISSSTVGSSTDGSNQLNRVSALMDAFADGAGKRWGVGADTAVYCVADPTTPTWILTPDSGRFGLADDNYASDLYVRYLASGTGYATAHVGDMTAATRFGRREYPVDATSLGLISSGTATSFGNGLLAKGKAKMGWTNGVSPSKWQLTTPGGTPAFLPYVKAGDLVRMFGVINEQGQPTKYIDWVIGETHYEAGADVIGLDPVGIVPTDIDSILSPPDAA